MSKAYGWIKVLSASVLMQLASPLYADGVIDLNYYTDSREFNTLGLFVQNSDLGGGFSFWGFSDFHAEQNNNNDRFRLMHSFSEYRINNEALGHLTGVKGLGLQVEYNYIRPAKVHVWRGAVTYNLPLSGRLKAQLRILPLQNNEDKQLSLGYFYPINDKLSISGFADYNLRDEASNIWVIEPQLNYQLHTKLWLSLEYRYNGFEDAHPELDGSGIAIGLKWNAL